MIDSIDRVSAALTHSKLYNMRELAGANNRAAQNVLGPMEHQAFAREWTRENPLLAVPSIAVATPLYYLAKTAGLMKGRSDPSLAELKAGYKGIFQGLFPGTLED
jgi:hypothetical protein